MKKILFLTALLLTLTACGTDDQDKQPPTPPPSSPMTLEDIPDLLFFNEINTEVVEKTDCGQTTLFHLSVEGKEVYIRATKATGLDHIYQAIEKSIEVPLACP